MGSSAQFYHAHIYFTDADRHVVDHICHQLVATFKPDQIITKLFNEPKGPHPLPFLEIDYHREYHTKMLGLIAAERGPLSVLVHPVGRYEKIDHVEHAQWFGEPVVLDMTKLSDDLGPDESTWGSTQIPTQLQPHVMMAMKLKSGSDRTIS